MKLLRSIWSAVLLLAAGCSVAPAPTPTSSDALAASTPAPAESSDFVIWPPLCTQHPDTTKLCPADKPSLYSCPPARNPAGCIGLNVFAQTGKVARCCP
jgi:hypothetical protein